MGKKKAIRASTYLDKKHGKEGSESRERFRDRAYSFYFGELIRFRRKELNMTQEELAKRIGKKRPYISRIENGEDIRISNLAAVANALGLTIEVTTKENTVS